MILPKTLTSASPCPCGLPIRYGKCCGRWHTGKTHYLQAPNPLLLMRSRYAAYVIDDLNYIQSTWHPSTRPNHIDANEPELKWLRLEIKAYSPELNTVTFVAHYRHGKEPPQAFEERSRFIYEAQQWWYVDAIS